MSVECGRPTSTGRPCRNAAGRCGWHRSPDEIAQREAEARARARLQRRQWRGGLVTYLRWRNDLPDLSGLPEDAAWDAFVATHDGRCAVCRTGSADVMDHNHETGFIRGLLCRSCNGHARYVGHLSLARLTADGISPAVALYVQWPPAAVCDVRAEYVGAFGKDPRERLIDALWIAGPRGIESVLTLWERANADWWSGRTDRMAPNPAWLSTPTGGMLDGLLED